MIKLIINDYWIELKNLAKGRKRSEWMLDTWYVCYFAFILPGMLFEEKWFTGKNHLWINILWVIIWIGLGICRLYPNRLEEMFYLLPVPEKDRRVYLLTGYWFRVLFFTALLGCYFLLWAVMEKLSLFWAGYCLFHYFLIMCMINTDLNHMTNYAKKRHGRWRWIVSYIVAFISLFLLYRASPGNNIWTDTASWSVTSWEAATSGIELLFAAIAGFSYWRMILRDSCNEIMNC